MPIKARLIVQVAVHTVHTIMLKSHADGSLALYPCTSSLRLPLSTVNALEHSASLTQTGMTSQLDMTSQSQSSMTSDSQPAMCTGCGGVITEKHLLKVSRTGGNGGIPSSVDMVVNLFRNGCHLMYSNKLFLQ